MMLRSSEASIRVRSAVAGSYRAHWCLFATLVLLADCKETPPPRAANGAAHASTARRDASASADAGAGALTRAETGGRWGFVAADGAWVIPATYAWVESFSEGFAAVKAGERWGFIDRTGRLVVAARYRDADSFSEGLAAVRDDEGWRYIDATGTVRVAGPYESARPYRCGAARVKRARAFRAGTRPHGTYESIEVDTRLQTTRETLFNALVQPVTPAPPTAPDGLDDLALGFVYAHADRATRTAFEQGASNNPLARPHWRLLEEQWDDQVWQTIDPRGEAIPPSEVPACGAPPVEPPPVPADLRAKLASVRDRMEVFRQISALGSRAVPVVLDALTDPRKQVRLNALEALARLGRPASAAVPALTAALDDRDGDISTLAVWALGRIGAPAASAVPSLARNHGRHARLIEAALGRIAPEAPEVVALLTQAEAQRQARDPLVSARRLVESHDPTAVRRLVALLGTPHKVEALHLLAALGPAARSAVPNVSALLDATAVPGEAGESSEVTARCETFRAAADALWRISDDARLVLPYLERPLQHSEFYFVQCDPWALQVVAGMGRAAAPLAPTLRRYARENREAREAVSAVLRALGSS